MIIMLCVCVLATVVLAKYLKPYTHILLSFMIIDTGLCAHVIETYI